MRAENWDLYPNFRKFEWVCRHCGHHEMQAEYMAMVQDLRDAYGKPLVVSSGWRCPEYNNKVSSTGLTGPHTTGFAGDFLVSGRDAHELLRLAMQKGFTGVGISQSGDHSTRFLHLDILSVGRPWIWSYGTN